MSTLAITKERKDKLIAAATKPLTERKDAILQRMTCAEIGDAVLEEFFGDKYATLRSLPVDWGVFHNAGISEFTLTTGDSPLKMSCTPIVAITPLQYSHHTGHEIRAPRVFGERIKPLVPEYNKATQDLSTLKAELERVINSCKTLNQLVKTYPSFLRHVDPEDLKKLNAKPVRNEIVPETLSDAAKGLLVKAEMLQ